MIKYCISHSINRGCLGIVKLSALNCWSCHGGYRWTQPSLSLAAAKKTPPGKWIALSEAIPRIDDESSYPLVN